MQTQLQSLSNLFSERLFRIPDYQRGYAWTIKQLEDFWSDIENVSVGAGHYTGVITLEDVSEDIYKNWSIDSWIIDSKRYKPYYVVDGQQRLTTCIILIQCILESLGDSDELNYTAKSDVCKKFIYDTMGKTSLLRTYIFGYEKDNPSYEFLKRHVFKDNGEAHHPDQETIYTANLETAKKFFVDQLLKLTTTEIEQIYTKITQSLLFNVYSISDEVDVFIAFETMNNRGKPLSHLELLKNRLIYLSTKLNSDLAERNKLRYLINEAWKSIYHYLGANKENPLPDDEFLYQHFTLYFNQNREKRYTRYGNPYGIQENYKDYILNEKFSENSIKNMDGQRDGALDYISSYVESLKRSVEAWFKIMNPGLSNFSDSEKLWLSRMQRFFINKTIPQSRYILVLLLAVFLTDKDKTNRVSLLASLERYAFISDLLRGISLNDVEDLDLMEVAIGVYKDKEKASSVRNQLEKWIGDVSSKADFSSNVSKSFRGAGGFYSWRAITYLLYEYEENLRILSKNSRAKMSDIDFFRFSTGGWFDEDGKDYSSIEHIYPQQSSRKACWASDYSEFTAPQRRVLKNSLGNLLALSKPKNSSLGNKCFSEKKGVTGSNIGYRYGSYSEMEVAENPDWSPAHILNRGVKILDFLEQRWSLKLGGRKDKINILALEFMS